MSRIVQFIRNGITTTIALPVESLKNNLHEICVENTSDLIICAGHDRIYAKNGELRHDQHKTIKFKKWVTFMRNTELFGFSSEGVD